MSSIEFDHLDLDEGFVQVPGKCSQISQKILPDTMDHNAKTGMRTRILRVDAGFQSFGQHEHPYWEELIIIKGSLYEGVPGDEERKLSATSYARREPGHMHGPARTDEVCYMIEINWYD